MNRFLIPLAITLVTAPLCHAGTVFKCSTDSGVSYQSNPCKDGTGEIPVSTTPANPTANAERQSSVEGLPAAAAQKSSWSLQPSRRAVSLDSNSTELQLGASDLQILNNRRWGKPQLITRSRQENSWHEYWTYESGASGGKKLHFVNGILADIERLEPPSPRPAVSAATDEPGIGEP